MSIGLHIIVKVGAMKHVAAGLVLALFSAPAWAQGSSQRLDPKKQEILNKLQNMKVDLNFENAPFQDVISYVRDLSGLNIVISAEVGENLSDDQLTVTLKVKELRLKSALKIVLGSRDLTATYKDGVILIIPKDSERNVSVHLQLYDVRDLLVKIRDFPGPVVELASPADAAALAGPLTGATFSLEEPESIITEDFIVEMIQANTGDSSWDELPNASLTLNNGILVVSQSRRVHGEIQRLINLLRQFK